MVRVPIAVLTVAAVGFALRFVGRNLTLLDRHKIEIRQIVPFPVLQGQ